MPAQIIPLAPFIPPGRETRKALRSLGLEPTSEPECENRMLPLLVVFVGACLLLAGLTAIAWGLWSSSEYVVHGLARLHGDLR